MMSQFQRYLRAKLGFSSICPVMMKVTMEMNRNAKGNETVALVSRASDIRTIPASAPNIRKERIMTDVMICWILSVSTVFGSS